MASALPQPGTAYPIELGSSFASTSSPDDGGLYLLRYDFKPASAGRTGEGSLRLDRESRQAALELPNSTEGASDLRFTGTYEAAGDGCDCIASFDGKQWRLEMLSGQCRNLRVARAASTHLVEPPVKRPRPSSAAPEASAPVPASAPTAQPPAQSGHAQPQQLSQASQPSHDGGHEKPKESPPKAKAAKAAHAAHAPQAVAPPLESGHASGQTHAAMPDWQMGFVPEQDSSEDEEGSNPSDDSNGDF